ncbi:acyl-CoA-binding protein [Sphaerotilus hippei]|uniref:Acyl-CoA-binding protein n=1 Tax=Sphaerotilus hippei TaxID=744406 RepID=A0A318H528_9BURK|nr:acyl-CoA-binding protein [Sphaerotilus hippei]PXW97156.1 acyl-CoA-binding protein [Sphaerotilus hippei]
MTQPQDDLRTRFDAAVAASKQLPERPDNQTLLRLYALYKQGSSGDVQGDRPGFADFIARAKWDAWKGVEGLAPATAQQQYIDLYDSLR